MKSLFPAEYYKENYERFIKPSNDRHYVNLNENLNRKIETLRKNGCPENAIPIVKKIEAEKLYNEWYKILKEDMKIVKEVREGKASFGFTTYRQEYEARAKFEKRFEFNCYQLAEFKKDHLKEG